MFEIKIDDRGKEYFQDLVDGTSIEIYKQIKSNDTWEEKEIPFILKKNENYFPHKTADVAILKIPYEYDMYFSQDIWQLFQPSCSSINPDVDISLGLSLEYHCIHP